jgi:6,7-dimethyl-8-ribityllumazine synthase
LVSIAIVRSEFNEGITARMLGAARDYAKKHGIKVVAEVSVPGAFEIPVAAKKLLEREDVEGVATVGAVIRGETMHDEVIGHAVATALLRLSLKYGKPVGLGIIGPGATPGQADRRAEEYAIRSVSAVVRMLRELGRI